MARNLENQTNVETPSAEYPSGRIRDNDGSGNGTPVDEAVYGDIHQFFAKLLRDFSVTPNDLPDNTTNGFQLFQAYAKSVNRSLGVWLAKSDENMGTAGAINAPVRGVYITKDGNKLYALEAGGGPAIRVFDISNKISPSEIAVESFNLPGGFAPFNFYVDETNQKIYITEFTVDECRVWDISTPTSPAELTGENFGNAETTSVGGIWIDEVAEKAYLGDSGAEINVYDISTPTSPTLIAGEQISSTASAMRGIFKVKDKLYVVDETGASEEIEVWDISTPTSPARITGETIALTNESPRGLFVEPPFIYVADFGNDTVTKYNMAGIKQQIITTNLGTDPQFIHIRDNRLYVADFTDDGIRVHQRVLDFDTLY